MSPLKHDTTKTQYKSWMPLNILRHKSGRIEGHGLINLIAEKIQTPSHSNKKLFKGLKEAFRDDTTFTLMRLHQLQMALLFPETSLLHFFMTRKKCLLFKTRHFSSGISTAIYRYVYV